MQRKTKHKVAVVCARGLGDGLISMVLTHNLTLAGHEVTTFSSPLCQLTRWFPGKTIKPFPTDKEIFSSFDQLIVADHAMLTEQDGFGNELVLLKEQEFDRSKTMVDNLALVCRHRLNLRYCLKENGITPPQEHAWKRHPKRVIIHPMSTSIKKNWLPEKFHALCTHLLDDGYQPTLCMSPEEQQAWHPLLEESQIPLPTFTTIDDLATYVYESGAMIGNDSGIGHLASCLNIPTLSLFARKSYAHLWRPGWGEGHVLTPPNILLGSKLKQKYWKDLLTVKQARAAFRKMTRDRG